MDFKALFLTWGCLLVVFLWTDGANGQVAFQQYPYQQQGASMYNSMPPWQSPWPSMQQRSFPIPQPQRLIPYDSPAQVGMHQPQYTLQERQFFSSIDGGATPFPNPLMDTPMRCPPRCPPPPPYCPPYCPPCPPPCPPTCPPPCPDEEPDCFCPPPCRPCCRPPPCPPECDACCKPRPQCPPGCPPTPRPPPPPPCPGEYPPASAVSVLGVKSADLRSGASLVHEMAKKVKEFLGFEQEECTSSDQLANTASDFLLNALEERRPFVVPRSENEIYAQRYKRGTEEQLDAEFESREENE